MFMVKQSELLDLTEEVTMIFRKVGKFLPVDMESQPKGLETSASPV